MAVKAEELRIGNWVIMDDDYVQVESISKDGINSYFDGDETSYDYRFERPDSFTSDYKTLKPIPLTPDILEACGFENRGEYYSRVGECFEVSKGAIFDGYFYSINFNEYTDGEPMKYLHQLQNLYFAMLQKELEYKPPTLFPNSLDEIEPDLNTLMQLKQKENK